MRPLVHGALVSVVTLAACSGGTIATSATETDAATTTAPATGTSTVGTDGMSSSSVGSSSEATTSTATTSTSTADPESSGGCSFLCGDHGDGTECDVFTQECDPGFKCNPWANDGGQAWNSAKCVPVDPNPDAIGEACTVVGNGLSGIDSCEKGAMCFYVDQVTEVGVCIGLCMGPEDLCINGVDACCPPGYGCSIAAGGFLALCHQHACDPILQDCDAPSLSCVKEPTFDRFICEPDISGDGGAPGDPCSWTPLCDPGTLCVVETAYPGCNNDEDACCAPFCRLDDPICPAETECLPFYDPMDPPPAFAGFGVCILPP